MGPGLGVKPNSNHHQWGILTNSTVTSLTLGFLERFNSSPEHRKETGMEIESTDHPTMHADMVALCLGNIYLYFLSLSKLIRPLQGEGEAKS